jgi:hypothetical protein
VDSTFTFDLGIAREERGSEESIKIKGARSRQKGNAMSTLANIAGALASDGAEMAGIKIMAWLEQPTYRVLSVAA